MAKKIKKGEIAALALIIVFFLAASYFSRLYADNLNVMFEIRGPKGMVIYLLATVIAVIIAPISSLPLLPISVNLWGPLAASFLNILGWLLGAWIAFSLARRFGKPLIAKFVNLKRIEQLESTLPKRNIFWLVVFLRLIMPVDLLSYALGLFSNISRSSYLLATFIGVAPFAFIFSYGSLISIEYQLVIGSVGIVFVIFGYSRAREKMINWLNKIKN